MYNVSKIKLKAGPEIQPGKLTVAIGPNNGGKSQFLKDLVGKVGLAVSESKLKSIHDVEGIFQNGPVKTIESLIENAKLDANGNLVLDGPTPDFEQPAMTRINPEQLGRGRAGPLNDHQAKTHLTTNLGHHLITHLTTERRLLLVKRQINRNPNAEGIQTPIEAAFTASQDLNSWINDLVFAAFGIRIVLDKSLFASAEYRVGTAAQISKNSEVDKDLLAKLPQLDTQGDGIRGFCGILVAASTLPRPVVAIDEPEAFLHPPQAFLMGRALAQLSTKGPQLFLATHSAEVLRGILSVTREATIVRFAQTKGEYTARKLDPSVLKKITDDPVLSSARVLDGLFYRGVAITESDGDVALYRTVLKTIDNSSSIGFINSYSKQLSGKILPPFHATGVPCAVLVDFDMVRVQSEFRAMYEAAGGKWSDISTCYGDFIAQIEGADNATKRIDHALAHLKNVIAQVASQGDADNQMIWLRARLKEVRDAATPWAELKRKGINALSAEAKAHFDAIDFSCKKLGLFIVIAGEREAWLEPFVGYTSNKKHWTELALQYLDEHNLPENHRLTQYVSDIQKFCVGE